MHAGSTGPLGLVGGLSGADGAVQLGGEAVIAGGGGGGGGGGDVCGGHCHGVRAAAEGPASL